MKVPISILILTLNEEANIKACLDSVSWCDDVVVLDSYSSDKTVALAEKAGARVYQRQFDDFAGQRNHALDSIRFKHEWIFHLDADERFTEALCRECCKVIAEDRHSGFLAPSKLMFMGCWLRWAGMYPTYQMRLLKLGEIRFVQHGHGQREAEAKRGLGRLKEPYLHYNFSKGMDDWLEKHNRYSSAEARRVVDDMGKSSLRDLIGSDALRRRRALKRLAERLPARPSLRFCYMYFMRLGFLDGLPGFYYCRLMAFYEFLIVLKKREAEERSRTSNKHD